MLPRYLRFARTVALVTTAATGGCRSEDPGADASKDTGAHDVQAETTADTLADGPDATDSRDANDAADAVDSDGAKVTAGACRELVLDGGVQIGCDAGGTCTYPESDGGDADLVQCTFGLDASAPDVEPAECGLVTCGLNCYCAGPAVSLCGCLHLGFSGPLAPPELPIVTASARRRCSPKGDRLAARDRRRRSTSRRDRRPSPCRPPSS
jgi:hypothetical protein